MARDQEAKHLVLCARALILRSTVLLGRGLCLAAHHVVYGRGDIGELAGLVTEAQHPGLCVLEALADEAVLVGPGAAVGWHDGDEPVRLPGHRRGHCRVQRVRDDLHGPDGGVIGGRREDHRLVGSRGHVDLGEGIQELNVGCQCLQLTAERDIPD
jgi:hypothetical protein